LVGNGSNPAGKLCDDYERKRMTERRVATAMNMAVRQRNYRRARERALTALAQQYPDNYKELLEREKARDEEEGRKWLDINGTTGDVGLRSATRDSAPPETSNTGTNQGYNGGEA
jgi:hypothetical protein